MKQTLKNLKNFRSLHRGRLPGQMVVQYTNHCNANCPQCGMRRSEKFTRATLGLRHAKGIIDYGARRGVRFLSLTGGEPLLFLEDVVELINHADLAGIPFIRTGTNGFLFSNPDAPDFHDRVNRIAEKLSSTNLYTFWISIDSLNPEDHEKIRGLKGIIKGIEKAIPLFHAHGIFPSANLGINRAVGGGDNQPFLKETTADEFQQTFESHFARFYQFVCDLGFTIVNACYPMSTVTGTDEQDFRPIEASLYKAASADNLITFTRQEKALIFKALLKIIPRFRGKIRIFSPRCSLYSLAKKYQSGQVPLFSCRGGTDFFFVECQQGLFHPCGYRDEPRADLPDLTGILKKVENCDTCEWECFRDPSDILGPFAEFFTQPCSLMRKVFGDPQFFKLLSQDLRYYRACGFFNGRHAPRFQAMQRFEDSQNVR